MKPTQSARGRNHGPDLHDPGTRRQHAVEVRHASNASAIFLADAQRIRELLPGDAFEVIESAPGRAELVLSLIDYIDNDLGD